MTNQIPENWLEQIDQHHYEEAIIPEAEEMIVALSVYFNINKPSQDSIVKALAARWNKPVEEILVIISAFVQFKAKITLLDCFYGDHFHHDEDENLVLTPDVIETIYGTSDQQELDLIKKTQKDLSEAGLYIEWMNIKFEYLS